MKTLITLALTLSLAIPVHPGLSQTATVISILEPANSPPTQVVFLLGGDATDSTWWFRDLTIFEPYASTLFIGIRQSYNLREELDSAIQYVRNNYELPSKTQWSIVGFSLGAYEIYSHALMYFPDVFGNYCAIGGGMSVTLSTPPSVDFFYATCGEYDMDRQSTEYGFNQLRANNYIDSSNSVLYIIQNKGHTKGEAREGLTNFLTILSNRYASTFTPLTVVN